MSLPLGLSFQNALAAHVDFNGIVGKIVSYLQSIDNYDTLKNHPELVLLTCNLVEYYMPDNKYKIDKKEMAIIVLDKVFTLTDDEKTAVRTQIQFFYDNKQIQPVGWLSYLKGVWSSFFIKK
jgi:hypothetical protein